MRKGILRAMKGSVTPMFASALLISVLAPMARAATAPSFVVPSIALTMGVLPQEVAVGDFDGDGHTDAALANQGPAAFKGGIATAPGNGAGGFGSVVTTMLPGGWGACDLTSADFDEDGRMDLAAEGCTTSGSGPIFLLLGTGTGSFTVSQQIASSVDVQLVAADFDGDGHADLASSENGGLGKVKVYLGTGTGTVGSATTYSGGFSSYDFVASDLNTDGHPDLVGASGGSPWTRLNQGNGTFGSQIYDPISTLQGIRLAVADFSGDGNPDVVVVDASGGHVDVGLGLGNGHFSAKQVVKNVSSQTNWVTAGDITGDGKLDLVADGDSNTAVLLKGRGDGTFGPLTRWMTGSEGLAAADLNGAGATDLVSFTPDPGTIYGTLASGGGFLAPSVIPSGVAGRSVSGDVNGDGRLDLVRPGVRVAPGKLQSVVATQLGLGGGRLGVPMYSPIRKETASSGPTQMRPRRRERGRVAGRGGRLQQRAAKPEQPDRHAGNGEREVRLGNVDEFGRQQRRHRRPGGGRCDRRRPPRHRVEHTQPDLGEGRSRRRDIRGADTVRPGILRDEASDGHAGRGFHRRGDPGRRGSDHHGQREHRGERRRVAAGPGRWDVRCDPDDPHRLELRDQRSGRPER